MFNFVFLFQMIIFKAMFHFNSISTTNSTNSIDENISLMLFFLQVKVFYLNLNSITVLRKKGEIETYRIGAEIVRCQSRNVKDLLSTKSSASE